MTDMGIKYVSDINVNGKSQGCFFFFFYALLT